MTAFGLANDGAALSFPVQSHCGSAALVVFVTSYWEAWNLQEEEML